MPGVRPSCAILLYGLLTVLGVTQAFRTVCYYDGKALWRKDVVKVGVDELKPILNNCTHLVYGYAGIDHEKFTAKSLNPKLDLPESKDVKGGNFKSITSLKTEFPHLTILLSVGGDADYEKPEKYLDTLNKPYSRTEFASTVSEMAKAYGFDGIDLAWQFPVITEKKEKYSWSSIVHKIAKTVGISGNIDTKEAEHKEQFTALVREVKGVLNANNCSYLSVSILPHVNITAYFDFPGLQKYVDHYTLMVYDFRNPFRVPNLADHASPSVFVYADRVVEQNIEWRVNKTLELGIERNKMVLGIATFGRTWKLDAITDKTGTPPLKADGPADAGTYTKTEGLLAYYEICPHLVESTQAVTSLTMFSRNPDSKKILGTYAFRLPNHNDKGIWISFEEPETAKQKATYVKSNNFGGLALLDLSMDDARGLCNGNKYPILKAVKTVF
ncbi:Chitinase II,Glycoside hydrolase superfamily,Glycoside hydrolase family 18, catalytic [Cinara cedri]|uniref:Chitinase II,Glycoside hydrolase superfamily,Glycoside hydrolase family 18, catalytic n=1 Tax=Cinara cedri TaxID=506608 RepID=A0A5E4M4S2_9HEMI|nr:Chitinase II,Glycoside hydrolase superfamily,Glycoside hydrolase family 18, catalytic [Cinara cedri]